MADFIAIFLLVFGAVLALKLFMFLLATGTTAFLLCLPVAIFLAVLGLFKRLFFHK